MIMHSDKDRLHNMMKLRFGTVTTGCMERFWRDLQGAGWAQPDPIIEGVEWGFERGRYYATCVPVDGKV